jgi:hypothetical protein
MTKARNIADLLDANGDVKTSSLDNVPASNDASALTTGTLNNARLPSNISDGGTEGTKIASGTTAQRGSTAGQFRFNSTTGKFEGFDGSSFKVLENSAIISSVNPTNFESSALPANIVITGENFGTGDTVKFIGNDNSEISSPSVTIDSATQITAQVPNTVTSEKEPHGIRVTSASGLSASLGGAFNIDASPIFGVASGSLGILSDANRASSNITTVTATDDEGDSITLSITSGSLPSGITFNSNGTFSGTANAVSSDTTSSFTITATDGTNTSTRDYTITVKQPVASGGTMSSYTSGGTSYIVHTFNSTSNFVLNTATTVDYLIVGGGGNGGNASGGGGDGAGGGGAGGYYYNTGVSMSAGTFQAVVGGSAQNSSFNGATAGAGGNGGNDASGGGSGSSGTVGGSGGGTGNRVNGGGGSAGSGGDTSNRNSGGAGYANDAGGGGGGSSAVGGDVRGGANGGHGGAGTSNSITGTAVIYAVGGGGGVQSGTDRGDGSANTDGRGGYGGTSPLAGTANRGNGGGGGGQTGGASGGSGIVVVRYVG